MLVSADYHVRVPRERCANLRFRRRVLRGCSADPAAQAAMREACRRDVLFWINTFAIQYNPNALGGQFEVGPFITWDIQEKAIRELVHSIEKGGRKDVLLEKSREMGASWLCLLVLTWFFLFHPWKKFLVISRSAEAVDKPEDPDSLFWKIDFIIEHLPDWMACVSRDKAGPGNIKRRSMNLRNRANNSTISGQATTGRAGVGGRATAIFVDEFSQIDAGFEVLHRTADTSGCRIFNFTHVGLDNAAYEMSQRVDVKKIVLHWSMHPEKRRGLYRYDPEAHQIEPLDRGYQYPPDYIFVMDGSPGGPFAGLRSPWYDAEEKRRASKRAVAMDLDIDPRGATDQFFDAVVIKSLQGTYACDPYWQGTINYDRDTAKPLAFVKVAGGPLKLWLHLTQRGWPPLSVYVGGADLSTGSGATPSCLTFVDCRTGEKVLEYTDPFMEPTPFAYLAVALCWAFKGPDGEGARLAWEMQGPGIKFGDQVIELGYRNVYYRTDELSLGGKVSDKPGWVPTKTNKRLLLDDYRAALFTHQFVNRSREALDECLSFIYGPNGTVKHGKEDNEEHPTGARENHGDHVIADALANKMFKALASDGKRAAIVEVKTGSLEWRRLLHETRQREHEAEAWA